jgi:histidine ammonia-lyase
MPQHAVTINGGPLSLNDVEAVARHDAKVTIATEAIKRMQAARDIVEKAAAGPHPVYGINTGFGSFANIRIDNNGLRELQRNLIRSHAAGVGECLPSHIVRTMMLILACNLARGHSGCRPEVVELLVAMLNGDVVPRIPSRGSVGASGDLAPLAHLALALIGEGEVWSSKPPHHQRTGAEALAAINCKPLTLEAKEGLSLINGTHMMCAIAAVAMLQIDQLIDAALAAAAMAIDACLATDRFLDARIHDIRGQHGQSTVAARLRELLAGSTITPSHHTNDPRVQDPYCLRAAPQVLGAALDAIEYARTVIERELGAVTDNPLVFPDGGDIISGGNFHGMPLAIAMDTLTIALTHIAGIAERRINWVLSCTDKFNPVPMFLSPKPGLHSGYMIVQYTAAACCNEMITLTTPASVSNITTSAGQEDYNSMGATSALQLRRSVDLATSVVAIELLVMAEAIEYHRPLKSGEGVERAHAEVRKVVTRLTADRPPSPDIESLRQLIRSGAIA